LRRQGASERESVPGVLSGKRVAALSCALIGVLALAGSAEAQSGEPMGGRAKNVIIFIGDGMGTSHRDLIRYASVGEGRQLAMDSMPVAGRSETSPRDPEAFVTDSAAGGTAIATGVKTFNGAAGVDVDENPVQSVLERAGREVYRARHRQPGDRRHPGLLRDPRP
jgi:alkaline phosphatase